MINPIKGHLVRNVYTGTELIISEIIGFAAVSVHGIYQDGSGGTFPLHIHELVPGPDPIPSEETLRSFLAGADENIIRLQKQLERVQRNRDFLLSLFRNEDES